MEDFMKKIASGKVREIYEVDDKTLAMVATDRISAFDVILPFDVPQKGAVLTSLSKFWFKYCGDIIPNHLISTDTKDFPKELQSDEFSGRTMIVKKLKMLPYEVIVRGYLFGSMWEEYKKSGTFLGSDFPAGMQLAQKLPQPIVTPSTKAATGHDENISVKRMSSEIGEDLANKIQSAAIDVYKKCYNHAYERGIIIADTKFEFGIDPATNQLYLADEVLTPDSSRFWARDEYKIGTSPKSYDKQFVRDYLKEHNLAGKADIPPLPSDVIKQTSQKYEECRHLICD